jgi:hypothetical protein
VGGRARVRARAAHGERAPRRRPREARVVVRLVGLREDRGDGGQRRRDLARARR